MRNFQLDITLSFEAESDAVEIMDRTAKLAEGFYTPRDKELIDKFVEHTDKALAEINLIVEQIASTKPSSGSAWPTRGWICSGQGSRRRPGLGKERRNEAHRQGMPRLRANESEAAGPGGTPRGPGNEQGLALLPQVRHVGGAPTEAGRGRDRRLRCSAHCWS